MWSVPKSRGRKKPNKNSRSNQSRGRRSAERELDAMYGEIFDKLDQIARGGDPLDAEMLVSILCGDGWQTGDLGHSDHESLEAVLEAAGSRTRAAGGVALTRVVAAMAPTAALAVRAQRVSADLIARGAPEPTWSTDLDQVTAVGCWVLRDVYGDGASVLCAFERAGRQHGLSIMVDYNHLGGWAKDILLAEDVEDMLELMRQGAEEAAGTMFMESMDPGAARRLLEDAVEATDNTWEPEVSSDFAELRALAKYRLAALPEPPERTEPVEIDEDERAEIVREFLTAPEAANLPSIGDSAYCARLIVDYGADYDDGKLLRVSPAKTEILLLGWLPKKVVLEPDDRVLLPQLVPAWIRWSARRQGLPSAALDELLAFTKACFRHFDEAYDDIAGASPGRALLEGLDPADTIDDLQDALDRRTFAMPYVGTRIGDDDFARLDPNDPDERGLLIQGEHPEYHEALADPAFDGEIDGVNPHLHLVMHEIVANQLWDNDPPEVWAAARRLLDAGHDRHDILHAIGHAAMPLMHASLTRQEPFDLARYRADLNNLGD